MVAQSYSRYPRAYEGIRVRFTLSEGRHGFRVTRAADLPTTWNAYSPGHPIRIRRVDPALRHGVGDRARLLEVPRMTRLAVHGADGARDTTRGLREHRARFPGFIDPWTKRSSRSTTTGDGHTGAPLDR